MRKDIHFQSGQVLVLALVVLTLAFVNTLAIISRSLIFSQNSKYSLNSLAALNLAEAGIDKAVASINVSGSNYNGESETFLGNGSYSVVITNINASTKLIKATGYIPNKTSPQVRRTVQIQISKGVGVSFNYGVQVGEGGFELQNNSLVNGSVYSNGNITMSNGSRITGDAYVAGGTAPSADQQSDCTNPNCADFIFGKNVSGQNILDVAQSFKPSISAALNKISLKLKKVGVPANMTVRILGDQNGQPNKNNILTSGTLASSLVTNQYGFADVTFSSNPTLNADTPYWILLDTNLDSTNYWVWSQDLSQGYTRGGPAWSSNWQASNPVWTNISADLGFKTFVGGVTTSIIGTNNSNIGGDAHAHTLQNLTVGKGAYYQTIQNVTAATLQPNSPDPPPVALPVSDANIQSWKNSASTAGINNGDVTGCPQSLGPGKITGNVSITNGCNTSLNEPVWITGNLTLSNNAKLKLNNSYGPNSGVIVVDGNITLSNNGQLLGSGTTGSFLMGLSTYDSRTSGQIAISADNGSTLTILYAGYGTIELHNNASLSEVTAWKLRLDNGAAVTYQSGLASMVFSSGPSGTFSAVKGTYQSN